jgi:hypothetical protein
MPLACLHSCVAPVLLSSLSKHHYYHIYIYIGSSAGSTRSIDRGSFKGAGRGMVRESSRGLHSRDIYKGKIMEKETGSHHNGQGGIYMFIYDLCVVAENIYMHICTNINIFIYMYIYKYIYIYIYMYVDIYIYIYIYIYICIYIDARALSAGTRGNIDRNRSNGIYMHTCVYICIYVCDICIYMLHV